MDRLLRFLLALGGGAATSNARAVLDETESAHRQVDALEARLRTGSRARGAA